MNSEQGTLNFELRTHIPGSAVLSALEPSGEKRR